MFVRDRVKKNRIVVSVTNDLVTDQRVDRSCSALTEAGFCVTLVGRRLKNSQPLHRAYRTRRMRLLFNKKVFFYAEYNIRLFLLLLFTKTDIFYANDTDTLPANYWAARLRRKPLFFDAHELFPEVPELVYRPRVKRFWTRIEDHILPQVARSSNMAAVTVCQSIADIYRQRYGLNMAVVRNVPMPHCCSENDIKMADLLLEQIPSGKHILLYQGAVNVGRGIEPILDAMPLLPDCHFVVAGVGDLYHTLRRRAESVPNVAFLGRVEPAVLHALTPKAQLGISLLENRGLNYYYSLPNRLADFVQAGVPVLATDFPEIRRVVQQYQIGTLVATDNTPQQIAGIIRQTLDYWQQLPADEKQRRFSLAAHDLSWENDKKTLLEQINTIL